MKKKGLFGQLEAMQACLRGAYAEIGHLNDGARASRRRIDGLVLQVRKVDERLRRAVELAQGWLNSKGQTPTTPVMLQIVALGEPEPVTLREDWQGVEIDWKQIAREGARHESEMEQEIKRLREEALRVEFDREYINTLRAVLVSKIRRQQAAEARVEAMKRDRADTLRALIEALGEDYRAGQPCGWDSVLESIAALREKCARMPDPEHHGQHEERLDRLIEALGGGLVRDWDLVLAHCERKVKYLEGQRDDAIGAMRGVFPQSGSGERNFWFGAYADLFRQIANALGIPESRRIRDVILAEARSAAARIERMEAEERNRRERLADALGFHAVGGWGDLVAEAHRMREENARLKDTARMVPLATVQVSGEHKAAQVGAASS